jgi:hypothetical protein
VANINADQHTVLTLKRLGELHVVQVTTHLAVNLTQDICGLGKSELARVSCCDYLRRAAELHHHFFHHWVVRLSVQENHNDQRMSDLSASAHVVVKLPLKFFTAVAFAIDLEEFRIFNINF